MPIKLALDELGRIVVERRTSLMGSNSVASELDSGGVLEGLRKVQRGNSKKVKCDSG